MILISKEEVDMDQVISHSPEKEQGELLTIVGDPEITEPCVFVKFMYLPMFYCLCYFREIPKILWEEQVT